MSKFLHRDPLKIMLLKLFPFLASNTFNQLEVLYALQKIAYAW